MYRFFEIIKLFLHEMSEEILELSALHVFLASYAFYSHTGLYDETEILCLLFEEIPKKLNIALRFWS